MHNGAYLCLDEAVRHHLDVYDMVDAYDSDQLVPRVRPTLGPMSDVFVRLHDLSRNPRPITEEEMSQMVSFLEHALSDPDAHPSRLASLVPERVPSGLPVHDFQFDAPRPSCN